MCIAVICTKLYQTHAFQNIPELFLKRLPAYFKQFILTQRNYLRGAVLCLNNIALLIRELEKVPH